MLKKIAQAMMAALVLASFGTCSAHAMSLSSMARSLPMITTELTTGSIAPYFAESYRADGMGQAYAWPMPLHWMR